MASLQILKFVYLYIESLWQLSTEVYYQTTATPKKKGHWQKMRLEDKKSTLKTGPNCGKQLAI